MKRRTLLGSIAAALATTLSLGALAAQKKKHKQPPKRPWKLAPPTFVATEVTTEDQFRSWIKYTTDKEKFPTSLDGEPFRYDVVFWSDKHDVAGMRMKMFPDFTWFDLKGLSGATVAREESDEWLKKQFAHFFSKVGEDSTFVVNINRTTGMSSFSGEAILRKFPPNVIRQMAETPVAFFMQMEGLMKAERPHLFESYYHEEDFVNLTSKLIAFV